MKPITKRERQTITDAAYDALVRELAALEKAYPEYVVPLLRHKG